MEGEGEGPVEAVAGEVAPQQGAQRVPPRGEFPQEPLESPLALHVSVTYMVKHDPVYIMC